MDGYDVEFWTLIYIHLPHPTLQHTCCSSGGWSRGSFRGMARKLILSKNEILGARFSFNCKVAIEGTGVTYTASAL